jgi:hypothetical protein
MSSEFISARKLEPAGLREDQPLKQLKIEGEKSNLILDRGKVELKPGQQPKKRISIMTHDLESKEDKERKEKAALIIAQRKEKKQKR